jgi:hypothetical protein
VNAIEEKARLAEWAVHNRRPVQRSTKRLNHRARRRSMAAFSRRVLADMDAALSGSVGR